MKIKKADICLVVAILVVALLCFVFMKVFSSGTGDTVVITIDKEVYKEVSLDENQTIVIEVDGKDGSNTLEVKDGYAKMIDSNCPDHLCEEQHKISKEGETIVCLPNKVVVEVKEGQASSNATSSEEKIDGVAK